VEFSIELPVTVSYNRNIMNFINRNIFPIILLSGLLFSPHPCFGESSFGPRSAFEGSSYNALNKIKEELAGQLEHNQKLMEEYKDLKKRALELEIVLEGRRREVDKLLQASLRAFHHSQERVNSVKSARGNFDTLQDDELVLKTEIAHTQAEIMSVDEKLNLWELMLMDVNYRKEELENDYKLESFLFQEAKRTSMAEEEALKHQYQNNLDSELYIRNQIKSFKKQFFNLPERVQQLKNENRQFENEMKELQIQRNFKTRENALLRDRRSFIVRTKERDILDRKVLRDEYHAIVRSLQKEYNEINKKLEKSLEDHSERKDLIGAIINIDKENLQLREDISSLQENIEGLDNKIY